MFDAKVNGSMSILRLNIKYHNWCQWSTKYRGVTHYQSCPSSVLVQISFRVWNFSSPDSNLDLGLDKIPISVLKLKKLKSKIRKNSKNFKIRKIENSYFQISLFLNFEFQFFQILEFFEFCDFFEFLNFVQTQSRLKSGTRRTSGHQKIQTLDLFWTSTGDGHLCTLECPIWS